MEPSAPGEQFAIGRPCVMLRADLRPRNWGARPNALAISRATAVGQLIYWIGTDVINVQIIFDNDGA